MAKLGAGSTTQLSTAHGKLQLLCRTAILVTDFTVVEGHRNRERQNAAYHANPRRSWVLWPNGKHNNMPSLALDVAPYPGLYKRPNQDFYFLMGTLKGVASQLGIDVRCGCDWDGDGETQDQRFHDLGHIELINP